MLKRHFGSSRRKVSTRRMPSRATVAISSPWAISVLVTSCGKAAVRWSARSLSGSVMAFQGSAGEDPLALDLLLQLQHAVEQGLRRRRAAGHIDVDGNDPVAA